MYVRFWGTRGSIAKAGPSTVRYGGNTSCVEVRSKSGTLVVLDCGTGAHGLGQHLVEQESGRKGHLLVGHTHWDHIQGLPFFAPFFVQGCEWEIYGPRGLGASVREALTGQMQYTYFPVTMDQLGARLSFHDLVEGTFVLGDIEITAWYLNHPALTLGYRLRADGVTVVYSTDHEPRSKLLALGKKVPPAGADARHARFMEGADLVIHDAQYTAAEYEAKQGWGHSTVEYVVGTAQTAGARKVALFHHDPLRTDVMVDQLLIDARASLPSAGPRVQVIAAAEGETLHLDIGDASATDSLPIELSTPARSALATTSKANVVMVCGTEELGRPMREALVALDHEVVEVADLAGVWAHLETQPVHLLILERDDHGGAMALCRNMRSSADETLSGLPVVMLADRERTEDGLLGRGAGVTDLLYAPYSALYARARIESWLLQTELRWRPAPLPDDETQRLSALHALDVLDTPPEERFDRITRIASALFDMPMALVSLVDTDRQWFKSCVGLDASETPRDMAFCAHAILEEDLLLVPDALSDLRFADNPVVIGGPRVRFYAGVPLALPDGSKVGTLCLIDHRPRDFGFRDQALLRDLGQLVEHELTQMA